MIGVRTGLAVESQGELKVAAPTDLSRDIGVRESIRHNVHI